MIKFSKEKVLLLHQLIAQETGGSIGVRDRKEYNKACKKLFMLSVAWNHKRDVIIAVLLVAAMTVALNMTQLLAAPSILGMLERQETIGKLVISIILFCGLLFVLTSAKAYVS